MSQWLVKTDGRACVVAAAPDGLELAPGAACVVRLEYGETVGRVCRRLAEGKQPTFAIQRLASAGDLAAHESGQKVAEKYFESFQAILRKSSRRVKLIGARISLDQKNLCIYCGGSGTVDLQNEARLFARQNRLRVDIRQIGARGEAMMLGGLGCCGQEICCARAGFALQPTSSMLRLQGVAPVPEVAAGLCGEFKCCYAFEEEVYRQSRESLPPDGAKVAWKGSRAKLVSRNVPSARVTLELENHRRETVAAKEISTNPRENPR
ncbi:MAG: regulatory iron-sulfur-containing complex subunit RicT [Kiritimatiellia bacterium]